MTSFQTYRQIRYLASLKEQRHPMLGNNRFLKLLMAFMWLYYAALLVFLGITMAVGMRHDHSQVAAFHVFDGYLPVLLIVDFWLRFILQETAARQMQPFALLPVRRSFLMHIYLTHSGLAWGNLYWSFLLVPFGLIAIAVPLGWGAFIAWWIGWWLLCVANGYAYQFCRALCMRHLAWVLLPAAVHAVCLYVMFALEKNLLDMPCTRLMYAFLSSQMQPFVGAGLLIAFLYWCNYRLQMSMVCDEVGKKEERDEVRQFPPVMSLNRFGKVGEYFLLELKMRLRNKHVRMNFMVGLLAMVLLSLIAYVSDVYDRPYMRSFVCFYNYIVLGMMTLVTIMCHEGNYIDGLMSRRESILQLLTAKYFFHVLLLAIPPIIQLPLMLSGKISVWMNVGYLFFTAGVVYPLLFQLAAYNSNTLPLNTKITGKSGSVQRVISLFVIFIPVTLERCATTLLGSPRGYLSLALPGLVGIVTYRLWLRHVYARFMLRRYVNMEGFRATRSNVSA